MLESRELKGFDMACRSAPFKRPLFDSVPRPADDDRDSGHALRRVRLPNS